VGVAPEADGKPKLDRWKLISPSVLVGPILPSQAAIAVAGADGVDFFSIFFFDGCCAKERKEQALFLFGEAYMANKP
jgi:hypothetical protein